MNIARHGNSPRADLSADKRHHPFIMKGLDTRRRALAAHANLQLECLTLTTASLFHNFLGKVDFFFLDAFAHFKAGKANHFAAGRFDELGNGLVGIFDERLLGQAVFRPGTS